MDITPGCVVISRAGHDKGTVYLVVASEGSRMLLVNGDTRKKDNPKKKNSRHLAYLGKLEIADAKILEDHMLRKQLSSWR